MEDQSREGTETEEGTFRLDIVTQICSLHLHSNASFLSTGAVNCASTLDFDLLKPNHASYFSQPSIKLDTHLKHLTFCTDTKLRPDLPIDLLRVQVSHRTEPVLATDMLEFERNGQE